MKLVFIIAGDSIRSLLHQKVLLALLILAGGMSFFFAHLMGNFKASTVQKFDMESYATNSPDFAKKSATEKQQVLNAMEQGQSMIQGIYYQGASFCGTLVALMIFSTAVVSEIRRGSIRLTLSKPVTRVQFLLGKYLGGVAVMVGYAVVIGGAVWLFTQSEGMGLSPVMKYAPWMMLCSQLMIGSVAMLLSLFMHPVLAAGVAFFAGNGLLSSSNPLFYLLPSYKSFNLFTAILGGKILHATELMYLSLYALDIVVLMLLLALWRFARKELV